MATGVRTGFKAEQAFMHACVCSDHPISPLIILQSSNLSLYSMFLLLQERVSDVPCLLLILKTLIAFQKMFLQNCKKVKSTNKEHHKQDQSQNRDSILPNQSIVSKEGLHIDK